MMASSLRFTPLCLGALLLTACPWERDESLTQAQAREALEQVRWASEAESLTTGVVQLSTEFTIGQAAEAAAEELRSFVESQLPCAEVELTGERLEVTYRARPGDCTYRGQTYSGTHATTVTRSDEDVVVVDHEWMALSNGRIELDGAAQVTWDLGEGTRRVVHEANWTVLATGESAVGSGDRIQRALDGGLAEGFRVDGSRAWTTDRGRWDLAIDGVEMRWIDPVPQAGSYTLVTPDDKSLALSFERLDDTTVAATVSSGQRQFRFEVSSAGAID